MHAEFKPEDLLQDADSLVNITSIQLLGRVVCRILKALIIEVVRLSRESREV